MIGERFAEFLARLRGGTTERARLAAILELNRALAAARDRNTLLGLVLDEAVRLFGAERGFVIRRAAGDRPAVAAARNLDREPVRNPDRKISRTVVGRCLEEARGVFAEDAQIGDLSASGSVADLNLRSVLCVPLRVGDAVTGCLYLDHRFHSGAFRHDDVAWLEAFADQCSIALHLHELLERVEQRTRAVEQDNLELAATVAAQTERLEELIGIADRSELRHPFDEFVGESPALLRSLHLLDRLVDGEFPVLLIGESGTGKEVAARAVWRHGPRAGGPFVPINVAAVAPDLLESELFGHVRGAFTGADRDRLGLCREADGGVLFLDEVTEMSLEMQARLLRFLEDRHVRPVGGADAGAVDCRVVAATNRDPLQAVEQGVFRSDLYYRLAVVTVTLPPLRDRRTDIGALAEHFLRQAAVARGGAPRRATAELLDELATRRWPGNLRQLRNEILRLDALADGSDLGPELLEPETRGGNGPIDSLDLADVERRTIDEALRVTGGNKAEAARVLGISRRSLCDRLRRSS